MFITKNKLNQLIDARVHQIINDKTMSRAVAMEYLVSLQKAHLKKFLEAVDLRRQSEEKLEKLDESAPDLDKAISEAVENIIET